MNIIFARVSKEEERTQDINSQIVEIFKKFELKKEETVIYKERGSAYDLDKVSKRKEFLKLIDLLFMKNTTIGDLFTGNIITEKVNLYIWDYSRIMRNLEYCLLFSILSCLYDVKIYSYKDGLMSAEKKQTPSEKLARYLMASIHSYSGEEYSYNISQNIKKAIHKDKDITVSKVGKKWGKPMFDISGNRLEVKDLQNLDKHITTLIKDFEEKGIKYYYPKIIKIISKKLNIKPSKSYISKVYEVYIKE